MISPTTVLESLVMFTPGSQRFSACGRLAYSAAARPFFVSQVQQAGTDTGPPSSPSPRVISTASPKLSSPKLHARSPLSRPRRDVTDGKCASIEQVLFNIAPEADVLELSPMDLFSRGVGCGLSLSIHVPVVTQSLSPTIALSPHQPQVRAQASISNSEATHVDAAPLSPDVGLTSPRPTLSRSTPNLQLVSLPVFEGVGLGLAMSPQPQVSTPCQTPTWAHEFDFNAHRTLYSIPESPPTITTTCLPERTTMSHIMFFAAQSLLEEAARKCTKQTRNGQRTSLRAEEPPAEPVNAAVVTGGNLKKVQKHGLRRKLKSMLRI